MDGDDDELSFDCAELVAIVAKGGDSSDYNGTSDHEASVGPVSEGVSPKEVAFSVGDKFGTFQELEVMIARYESANFVQVWKREARTIIAAKKRIDRFMKPELKYYQLKFCCVHGGKKFKSVGRGLRGKTMTIKQDCPMHIGLKVNLDGLYLEVTSVCFEHNHPISQELYKDLPRQRHLPDQLKEEAASPLKKMVRKRKRGIKKLPVTCSCATDCDWTEALSTLNEHVATCDLALIPCPNQCQTADNKAMPILKKDLANHLERECPKRDFECVYCREKSTYEGIEIHLKTCEMMTLLCPNTECTNTIERRGMKRHLDDCIYTEVPCKYRRMGCDVRMKRHTISAHEGDDNVHLHMALSTIQALEKKVRVMDQKIFCLEEKVDKMEGEGTVISQLENGKSLTFKIRNFAQEMEQNNPFYSPSFYTVPNGYHIDLEVHPGGSAEGTGSHVSVFVRFLNGRNDRQLPWPFEGKITIMILNQLQNTNHHEGELVITSADDARVRVCRGFHKFIAHSELACNGNTQYLMDGALYFRVSVTLPDSKPWLDGQVD